MKNLLKLGTALTRAEQKMVNGGVMQKRCMSQCSSSSDCTNSRCNTCGGLPENGVQGTAGYCQ